MEQSIREKLEDFLKKKTFRLTKPREVILETIFGSTDHFTAEELLEKVSKIDKSASRATIYRTLSLLVEGGLLREIDLGKEVKHYDPNFLDHPNHNHLICTDCDHVVEFHDEHIELLNECIARRLGFQPALQNLRIEAHCDQFKRSGTCEHRERRLAAR